MFIVLELSKSLILGCDGCKSNKGSFFSSNSMYTSVSKLQSTSAECFSRSEVFILKNFFNKPQDVEDNIIEIKPEEIDEHDRFK